MLPCLVNIANCMDLFTWCINKAMVDLTISYHQMRITSTSCRISNNIYNIFIFIILKNLFLERLTVFVKYILVSSITVVVRTMSG